MRYISLTHPTRSAIALVEDHPDRVRAIAEVLRGSSIPHRSIALDRRDRVMDFLCRQGEYTQAVRPDLMRLNVDLSKADGRSLLSCRTSKLRIPIYLQHSCLLPSAFSHTAN